MSLPAPTGFKITEEHHPNKVAPVGQGPLHLRHAMREQESRQGAESTAEPLPSTGISGRGGGGGGGGTASVQHWKHANQAIV